MKTIKIFNGEVIIKDYCSRKLKKAINRVLYKNVSIGTGGQVSGFSPDAMDEANDIAMVGMIEKIVVDGQEKPVSLETLDAMNSDDIDLIIAEVNKITTKEIPNA